MNYTLKDLQQIDHFHEMQVIAGKDGLHNIVRYAGVLDAPDSVQFTREGEFVMTTGYILVNDNNALMHIIEELHQKKAAALGIKMFRYLQSFPEDARNLADQYALPIFFIPNRYSWHDLMMPLLLNICVSNDITMHYLDIYDHLLNILRRSQTIPEIISKAGALLNYPLTLINKNTLFTLNCPNDYRPPLPLSEETLSDLCHFQTMDLQNGKVHYYHNAPSIRLLITELDMKEYQYLILWDCPSPQNPTVFNSVIYSFILIQDAIHSQINKQRNLIHRKNVFLNELLNSTNYEQPLSRTELQNLQINDQIPYSLAVCKLFHSVAPQGRQCPLTIFDKTVSKCFEYLFQHYSIHSCVDTEGTLHFLLPIHELWCTPQDIITYTRKYGEQIRKYRKNSFPDKYVCLFVGSTAENWNSIPLRHRETLNVFELLDHSKFENGVVYLHDIGAIFLLSRPEIKPWLADFYDEYFRPLEQLEHFARQNIISTLITYIQSGFNFRETARILNVHHNTVRNRMEQFSDLTGLTITQHEDLLILLICLHIFSYNLI